VTFVTFADPRQPDFGFLTRFWLAPLQNWTFQTPKREASNFRLAVRENRNDLPLQKRQKT